MTVHDPELPTQRDRRAPDWADLGGLAADTRTVALGLEGLDTAVGGSAQAAVEQTAVAGLAILAARSVSARATRTLHTVHQAHGIVALLAAVAGRVRELAESTVQGTADAARVADAAVFADLTAQAEGTVALRIGEATEAAEDLMAEVHELEHLLAAAEHQQIAVAESLRGHSAELARLHLHAQRAATTAWDRALTVGGVREPH